MIYLEEIPNPLTQESLEKQIAILNSDREFLMAAEGKKALTRVEIIFDNKENLQAGAKYFYIKKDQEYIGLIHYIPINPSDDCCWLGLFIIDKNYQNIGIGEKALFIFEEKLKETNISFYKLCVQVGNNKGARFWNNNGFINVAQTTDIKGNLIDIYEKEIV